MHNTTMRDKLASVLGTGIPIPLTGARARRLGSVEIPHKKRPYMASQRVVTDEVESPRYIVPPKKSKPFAVHVYPMVSPFATGLSSLKVVEEEEPAVEANKEPLKVETELEPEIVVAPPAIPVPRPVSQPEAVPEPKLVVNTTVTPEPKAIVQEKPKPILVVEEKEEVSESIPPQKAISAIEVKAEAPQSADLTPAKTSLPPDLKWLEKQTPFVGDLQSIVGRVRDAKARIAFTLEQLRHRESEIQKQYEKMHADLDTVQFQIEQHRDYVHQLDEMIAACALVAEQSAALDVNLFTQVSVHHHQKEESDNWRHTPKGKTARWSNDPIFCHRKDILDILQTDKQRDWRANDVQALLPDIKQKHGHKVIPNILANLVNEGILERVSLGVYRFMEA